ncbi:MAG TPA: DUF748 domain-containing protein, partial [Candidatus Binataceae bacterium]|nr:DUF748 domain-containing protein [Candidatus Binataceae bacterium]
MSENSAGGWFGRIRAIRISRRIRRITITILIILIVYALAGFVGVPLVLEHVAATQGAAALHRPVSIEHVYFNPFRLRLEMDKLHVGGREANEQFVDLGHLHVKVSWTSLFKLAPIVHEVSLTNPDVHIVRNADKSFNFSDLIPPPSQQQPPPPSKPLRFAVSNIQLAGGRIQFDDKLLNSKHLVDQIRLAVPFIANLPADIDVFVQPLLEMIVDGSPLRLTGKAKPFANPPESEIDLNLHQLALPDYAAYLPPSVPIKLPKGVLTVGVQIHFVNAPEKPLIKISGTSAIDDLDVRDGSNSPLLGVNHFGVDLADVEPLSQVVHLDKISVDGLSAALVRNADGTTNLTPLMNGKAGASAGAPHPPATPAPQPAPSASTMAQSGASPIPQNSASPVSRPSASATSHVAVSPVAPISGNLTQTNATPAPTASQSASAPSPLAATSPTSSTVVPPSPQPTSSAAPSMSMTTTNMPPSPPPSAPPASQNTNLDFTLGTFELVNSSVKVTDNSVAPPAVVSLQEIRIDFSKFQLGGKTPSPFDFAAKFSGGGTLAVKGALDLTGSRVTTDIALEQLDLPALQGFAQSAMAAHLASGKLTAHASVRTDF